VQAQRRHHDVRAGADDDLTKPLELALRPWWM